MLPRMSAFHACLTTAALMLLLAGGLQAAPPAAGAPVFATGFETAADRAGWPAADFAAWAEQDRSVCLRVTAPPARSNETHLLRLPVDLTPFRGCRLLFECRSRAEQVTRPRFSYLGVKFMLHYRSATAGPVWQNECDVYGSFDWRPLRFSARIAGDATDGEIQLGLQGCSGTAWFDDVRITVLRGPVIRPPPPSLLPPPFRGHDLPRLRGAMVRGEFREQDLALFGGVWNANLIRWQLSRNWGAVGTDRDLAEYDAWIDRQLTDLDRALEASVRHGLKVVVDLHTPPGGRYPSKDLAIFHEPVYQQHWMKVWQRIARRYKGHPAVWGYDLVNEPVQTAPPTPGVPDCLQGQAAVAQAIREIDPVVPIFIAAGDWDSPAGFADLEPVAVSNVIYQVHVYSPMDFTHQGVHDAWKPVAYPGAIAGAVWNRERIRQELQPVRDFQLAYNVHIYVGEFSAIRWAPGAAEYLRDCIELFEEYGWDWSYHAFREWHGWNVECGSVPADERPSDNMTDRKQLLLEWYSHNRKPRGQRTIPPPAGTPASASSR